MINLLLTFQVLHRMKFSMGMTAGSKMEPASQAHFSHHRLVSTSVNSELPFVTPLALPAFCQRYSLENPPLENPSDTTMEYSSCTCLDSLEDEQIRLTYFILPSEKIPQFSDPGLVVDIHLSWADPEKEASTAWT